MSGGVRGWVFGGIVLAAMLGAGTGCTPTNPRRGQADEKLPPQVALYGVRLHSWEGGELVAVGRAAKLTYDRSSGNFEAAESLVQFPSRSAEPTKDATSDLELRAPVARGNLLNRTSRGEGGLTLRSANGLVARTQSAEFDGMGLVATGKEPINVTGPGYSVSANGFTFYLATEELLFEGDVVSRLGRPGAVQ